MATRLAVSRVPSSGSDGEPGIRARQLGFEDEEGVGGLVGISDGSGSLWWRREKRSLMSWFSRVWAPLEVRREMRPSVRFVRKRRVGGGVWWDESVDVRYRCVLFSFFFFFLLGLL